ncbi:MAG TPA: hypothetical protein VEH47_04115, partial [Candidatus Acidoferrales bacterium]|nr:hypothetical protein [Candidatus Acidoferrales bacterium]
KPSYAEPATVIPSEDFMVLRVTTVHENRPLPLGGEGGPRRRFHQPSRAGCPRIVGAATFGRPIPSALGKSDLAVLS